MIIKASVGIDQSLTNTGVCVIDMNGKILYRTTLKTTPKDGDDYERTSIIINKIERFLHISGNLERLGVEFHNLVVTREHHGFQVHGRAGANLVLAGRIDEFFASPEIIYGINYFAVSDAVWKKTLQINKPTAGRGKKKLTPKQVEQKYLGMYPGYGSTVHELDAFFLAFYGLRTYMENVKNVHQEPYAEEL